MSKKVQNKCKKYKENIFETLKKKQKNNGQQYPTNVAKKSKICRDYMVKIWWKVVKEYPNNIHIRSLHYKNCFLKSFNFKNPIFLKCFNFKNTKISKVPFLKCFNFKKRKFQNFACFKPEVGTVYGGTFQVVLDKILEP